MSILTDKAFTVNSQWKRQRLKETPEYRGYIREDSSFLLLTVPWAACTLERSQVGGTAQLQIKPLQYVDQVHPFLNTCAYVNVC